jgi:hypothetical protein
VKELGRRLERVGVQPLFGVVLLLSLWYLWPTLLWMFQHWNSAATPTWAGTFPGDKPGVNGNAEDIDTWFIHGGLVKAPHFGDTWQWWTGTWVGQVPFYRPLLSMVFWMEWQLFGDHETRYVVFALILHLLVVIQFSRVAYALFRMLRIPQPQWAMLLACLVFVDGLYSFPTRQITNSSIFALWKNQPDSLCALFFLLALDAYLRAYAEEREDSRKEREERNEIHFEPQRHRDTEAGERSEGPDPGQRKTREEGRGKREEKAPAGRGSGKAIGWAVGWFAASCLCKEAGVLFPFLLLCLEWPYIHVRLERRAAVGRLWPMFAVLILYLVVRAICLAQLVGFRYGDNSDWPVRLVNVLFGPLARVSGWQHPLMMLLGLGASGVLAGWLWRRQGRGETWKPRQSAVVGIGLLVLLTLAGLVVTPGGWNAAHLMSVLRGYVSHITVSGAIGVALFVFGVGGALLYHRRLALFGYAWVVTTLVFLLLTPSIQPFLLNGVSYAHYTNVHRYYLVEAGFALMIGGGLMLYRRKKIDTLTA